MSLRRQLPILVFLVALPAVAWADPGSATVGFDRLPGGDEPRAGDPVGTQFAAAGVVVSGPTLPLLVALPGNESGSRPYALGGAGALASGVVLTLVDPDSPGDAGPRARVTLHLLSVGASRVRVVALDAAGDPDPAHPEALVDGTGQTLVLQGAERLVGPDTDADVLGIGYRDRVVFEGASVYALRVTVEEDFNGDVIYLDDLGFALDNCPDVDNEDQANIDGDGLGDACDDDIDGDDVPNDGDNCPIDANTDQIDSDGDGLGDVCSPDADGDGIPRDFDGDGHADAPCRGGLTAECDDNCPLTPNSDQRDSDVDGIGNVCDPDLEGDGVPNDVDNCPETTNQDQADLDEDGLGDLCDDDDDGDDVLDTMDNCAGVNNPDQANLDLDREGDACDDDDDADNRPDDTDNCPRVANEDQGDADFDGFGDVCDSDADNDAVEDIDDNCPIVANPDQADLDSDGSGDACDVDDDGDDVDDLSDNCPLTLNSDQRDTDSDGVGDACDSDPDGDTFLEDDNCPSDFNPGQRDSDNDGIGDECDGSSPTEEPAEGCGCKVPESRAWSPSWWLRRR